MTGNVIIINFLFHFQRVRFFQIRFGYNNNNKVRIQKFDVLCRKYQSQISYHKKHAKLYKIMKSTLVVCQNQ